MHFILFSSVPFAFALEKIVALNIEFYEIDKKKKNYSIRNKVDRFKCKIMVSNVHIRIVNVSIPKTERIMIVNLWKTNKNSQRARKKKSLSLLS